MKFYLMILMGITVLQASNIESNIIKGYANTNDSVVEDGDKEQEIIYMTPKIIEEEEIVLPTEIPKPIEVKKDYTDANILLYKQELDKEANNFTVSKGKSGSFVAKSIFKGQAQSSQAKKLADKNKDLYQRGISGKCLVASDMLVSAKSMAKLACKTKNGEYLYLIMNLNPNDRAYALTAEIVSFIDGQDQMHKVDAQKSFISNYDGSTNNIATYVNTHRIEKNLALFGKGLTEGAVNAGNLAVDQLRQSMTKQEITIANTGLTGQVVQTTNTRRPTTKDLQDYGIIGAATGLLKGIGNVVSDIAKNDESWSYKIEKNSILHFNLVY